MKQLRIYFLNVGQGDCTYIECASGERIWRILIDCNLHPGHGIDVIRFLKDQIPKVDRKRTLDYVIVTHPHKDHISGLGGLVAFSIGELWDSGHVPEDPDTDHYKNYEELKEQNEAALKEWKMSRSPVMICGGEVAAHVFSPSRFIRDDEEMTETERREAIHEECMVVKLTFGDFSLLLTGDSNRAAWERIAGYEEYGAEVLASTILHASHHGSRTFFKRDEDDEPYTNAIEMIRPDHLLISVSDPSPHEHPHPDAMELYRKYVKEENIWHTSKGTVICVVGEDGSYTIDYEDGSIQERYALEEGDDDDGGGGSGKSSRLGGFAAGMNVISSRTRIDDKPAA